jgi:hypothetical protein
VLKNLRRLSKHSKDKLTTALNDANGLTCREYIEGMEEATREISQKGNFNLRSK